MINSFNIDTDDDVETIAQSFALFAAHVFNEKFPDEDGSGEWKAAMATVVRMFNQHVQQIVESDPASKSYHS